MLLGSVVKERGSSLGIAENRCPRYFVLCECVCLKKNGKSVLNRVSCAVCYFYVKGEDEIDRWVCLRIKSSAEASAQKS